MPRSILFFGVFVALAAGRLFGASCITYAKDGTPDSIILDLSITASSRREDGALVLRISGSIEKRPVRLKVVIGDRWRDWKRVTKGPRTVKEVEMEVLADGPESEFLDKLVSQTFQSETPKSMFCSTYVGLTSSSRGDLERRRTMFWIDDCGLCGSHEIQLVLDIQHSSAKMAIFEGSYGGPYRDRINEVFGEKG
jgi:hypothetical protein